MESSEDIELSSRPVRLILKEFKRRFEQQKKARLAAEEEREKARIFVFEEEREKARKKNPALGSQKSSQIPNRPEQETPNESSANRLNKSTQTINRAEQETSNESCVKENDYTNRFGKIDIKPRGKIPSDHTKILRKHYLSIMENIQVKDIMDHLFSGEVMDWNEMDVIETKLKVDGNREALRYLVKILYNSGETALPIFIQCLNQTGYSHVAELLQNPAL